MMKLNKKYQTLHYTPSKAPKADAFFPIFLSSYEKLSGAKAAQLLHTDLQWKWKAQHC